jgi:hypothetical protein
MSFPLDPTRYHFADESRFRRIARWFFRVLFPIELTALAPPVIRKGLKPAKLDELGQLVGLGSPEQQELLRAHATRLKLRDTCLTLLTLATFYVFIALLLAALLGLIDAWLDADPDVAESVLVAVFLIVSVVFSAVYVGFWRIAVRFSALVTDRYFAESLCAAASIYLLLDLARPEAVRNPLRKQGVLERIHALGTWTALMGLRHSGGDPRVRDRIGGHFKQMEQFVREREGWLLTPMESTVADVRGDIQRLAEMYVRGDYGRFTFQPGVETPISVPSHPVSRAFRAAGRGLALTTPLIVLAYLLINPDDINLSDTAASVLPLVFVAWLLLTLDTVLKLGVVSNVVALAKGIKDLK